MTLNEPVAVLPAPSEAEHETVVVPTLNLLPELGEHETERLPLTTSVADTVKLTFAPDDDDVLTSDRSRGSVSTGGTVSFTVTLKVPVALLPELTLPPSR